ncbi:MAG TPA: hypothetical protein VN222_10595 [Novosphingobium sp.]|nr:hypothetical protein [Novosphingobium sp.]
MAELSPAVQTAMVQPRVPLFGAVRIQFPTYDLRLLDGSGTLSWNGLTYVGRDPTYGTLDTIKGLADQVGDQAPELQLGLIPADDVALSLLTDPSVQGATVTASIGVFDMLTGIVLPDPYAVFVGELDVPSITWDANDRRLEYTVISVADRFFQIEEGRRLSDAFHRKVWPGETGMKMATGVEYDLPWAQKWDSSVVYTRSNLPGYTETYNRT